MRDQRIAILASGSGSNAEAIIERFKDHPLASVEWVGCNRSPQHAGIYERAKKWDLTVMPFSKSDLDQGVVTRQLQDQQIDWVVLAGFLLKIPMAMVDAFEKRIINIHPALLPKHGGPGMYGQHVHAAVHAAGEIESGMTIHYVSGNYDEGEVIFQASCALESGETPEEIAQKVLALEYRYYPLVLEALVVELADN